MTALSTASPRGKTSSSSSPPPSSPSSRSLVSPIPPLTRRHQNHQQHQQHYEEHEEEEEDKFLVKAASARRHYFVKGKNKEGMLFFPLSLLYKDLRRTQARENLLHLDGWRILDEDLERIAQATAMGCLALGLARNSGLRENGCLLHLPKFRCLEQLRLSACAHVTDKVLSVVALSCSLTLRKVDVAACRALTDGGLARFVAACPSLEELVLAQLPGLGDRTLQALGQGMVLHRKLQLLDVSQSVHFSNESFFLMVHQAANVLRTLRAHECTQITELGLISYHGYQQQGGGRGEGQQQQQQQQDSSSSSTTLLVAPSPPAASAAGGGAARLTHLDVSGTLIHDLALSWIGESCRNLTHLNLDGCELLRDPALIYLAKAATARESGDSPTMLLRLQSLSLNGCRDLTDEGLGALFATAICSQLQSLELRGCVFLSDLTLQAVGSVSHGLEHLSLVGLTLYTDLGLRALAHGCPGLVSIDLSMEMRSVDTTMRSHMTRYTTRGIEMDLASCCTRLTSVKLAGGNQLQDIAIQALAMHCPKLVTLVLRACCQLTDLSLIALGTSSPLLEHLNLSGCQRLTDRGILALIQPTTTTITNAAAAAASSRLRRFEAAYCTGLSDIALAALGCGCPDLEFLNLQGCHLLTDRGLASFLDLHAQVATTNSSVTGSRSRLKTLLLNALPRVTGCNFLANNKLSSSLPRLTTLDMNRSGAAKASTKMPLAKSQRALLPAMEGLAQEAEHLAGAEKGESLTLEPASESVRLFNAWLGQHRQQIVAAEMICACVERFLHRCRFLRLYRKLCHKALMLQRLYRGYRGRQRFQRHKAEFLRRRHAAIQIQRRWRGWSTRKQVRAFRLLAEASTYILQSAVRRYLYRRAQERLARAAKRWHHLSQLALRRHEQGIYFDAARTLQRAWKRYAFAKRRRACIQIQSLFRGHFLRHVRLVQWHAAATTIQRAWRSHRRWIALLEQARREHALQQAHYHHCRHAAATRLQAWHRKRMAQAQYLRQLQACRTLQRGMRCHQARTELTRRRWGHAKRRACMARRVQRAWRRTQLRFQAACNIQCLWRRVCAQRRRATLEREGLGNGAARTIQKNWRHYRNFMRWKGVAKNVRSFIHEHARRQHEQMVQQRLDAQRHNAAASMIQRAWRLARAWKRAKAKRQRFAKEAKEVKSILKARHNLLRQMAVAWSQVSATAAAAIHTHMPSSPSQRRRQQPQDMDYDSGGGDDRADALAVMLKIKQSAKKAEVQQLVAEVTTSSSLSSAAVPAGGGTNRAKALMDEQVEAALLKYHLPLAVKQMSGIVDLRLTVGPEERRVMETTMQNDLSRPHYHRLPVDLSFSMEKQVYLWYLLGPGTDALHEIELHSSRLPKRDGSGGQESFSLQALAARHDALLSAGIASCGHERLALELHGYRGGGGGAGRQEGSNSSWQSCPLLTIPIDKVAVLAGDQDKDKSKDYGNDPRWVKLHPTLAAFGLAAGNGAVHLWVHHALAVDSEGTRPPLHHQQQQQKFEMGREARLNLLCWDLLASTRCCPWYQHTATEADKERLQRVMAAYALCLDDVLEMHDIFTSLDHKHTGTVDALVFFDFLDEPASVYAEAIVSRIVAAANVSHAIDPMERLKLDFPTFVHAVSMLAMWDLPAAQQFVFVLLDEQWGRAERSGAVHVKSFRSLLLELRRTVDVTLAVDRMERLFRLYADPHYLTMDFEVFQKRIAPLDAIIWPLERLMKKAQERVCGSDFWRQQHQRFAQARRRLGIVGGGSAGGGGGGGAIVGGV